ncbi:hypothetical protein OROMI_008570 [Orobanche minor]
MIRKNALENILAERDILISVHNPFAVSIFLRLKMVLLFESEWITKLCEGKYLSDNEVFKWRRSFLHADKSRLLRGRYGTCIYRRSCRELYCYFLYSRDLYRLSSSKSLTYNYLFLSGLYRL